MTTRFAPVAVVGQACVLPGALDPGELWAAVAAGRDLVSAAPPGRWGLPRGAVLADSAAAGEERAWSDRGGYVAGFEAAFDAEGFGLPAEEVLGLDPLFQWVLHTARGALRSAGMDGSGAPLARVGAVLGNLSFPTRQTARFAESTWLAGAAGALGGEARERLGLSRPPPQNRFMSGLPAHLLVRGLGLGAGTFALDAACASSLYALKLACDRLHDGRADAMLAGAVACADDLFIHIGFSALEALSPSGRSRPFHRDADGLLPAEGAAFVVLKRLDDALANGDTVLGVVRGIGLSNDGRGRGILVPSEAGQVRAIRQAYEVAGVGPEEVSLVECHATGTKVGDATEIRSLGEVYRGLEGVAIGSLKSNLGHPITVAGLAGLLKVLAALDAGMRPPTLHAEEANPALAGSPFRLLGRAEPWPDDRPRMAALSAFGFGGNNGHLIVEQWHPELAARSAAAEPRSDQPAQPVSDQPAATRTRQAAIAVVGLGVVAADGDDARDFASTLFSGAVRLTRQEDGGLGGRAETITLPLDELRFPPRDLEQTLPQQLLVLKAALQATAQVAALPQPRTGVLVGMGCDAEVARWGMRWRLAGATEALGFPGEEWLRAAQDAVVPRLQAAGVVGTMPNMPANRINSQLDLGGMSCTVAAEELSGLVGLDLAVRALAAGELDAALVGAVDLSCEPVHLAAAGALLPADCRTPGDAAVVLVLKRLADARRDGDQVLALVSGERSDRASLCFAVGPAEANSGAALSLAPQLGHAHAASGLLHVAAAVLACHHRALPRGAGRPAVPWLARGRRRAAVSVAPFAGLPLATAVQQDRRGRPGSQPPPAGLPRLYLYSADDRAALLRRLAAGGPPDALAAPGGLARVVLVAATDDELAAQRERARRVVAGEEPAPAGGVHFREGPLGGELAFVFTGGAAAYAGMGRELLLAMPELLDRLGRRMRDLVTPAGWVYGQGGERPEGWRPSLLDQLWGCSFLCQAHAELSRHVLGLTPDATLGYSSGESNALVAMGAWDDLDAMYHDTATCGVFTHYLAGDFAAVHAAWERRGLPGARDASWANWVVGAPVEAVRAAVAAEELVRLTIVNTDGEVVIGGEAAACRRVLDALGAGGAGGPAAAPLGYDMTVHCPEVEEIAEHWLELHRRPTHEVDTVRFYTNATGGHFRPTREAAAQAILGQAVTTLDFPRLVNRAFDDGVRVFLEHGPRGLCSGWTRAILARRGIADDAYLAVPLDRSGGSGLRQAAEAAAQLLAAGVPIRCEVFAPPAAAGGEARRTLSFRAHWPAVALPPLPVTATVDDGTLAFGAARAAVPGNGTAVVAAAIGGEPQVMTPAPWLPPVVAGEEGFGEPLREELGRKDVETPAAGWVPAAWAGPWVGSSTGGAPLGAAPLGALPPLVAVPPSAGAVHAGSGGLAAVPGVAVPVLGQMAALQARIAEIQREHVLAQTALHRQFLDLRQRTAHQFLAAGQGLAATLTPFAAAAPPASAAAPGNGGAQPGQYAPAPPTAVASAAVSAPAPRPATGHPLPSPPEPLPPPRDLPGPKLSRRELEVLAGGRISSILGPQFAGQDGYHRQVRLPEPPLLLVDRVTGIDGAPGSMGLGTIWTETDVAWDSWYLNDGYMPGGVMIEAGQADLLLISWLGVDALNRGERIYRLLGCELTYCGPLPRPGETLRYDIHVDGHAAQGDVRLFFFHYDCRIDGVVRLRVRHGQAGFFTDDELAQSAGVLWDAESAELPSGGRLDPPFRLTTRRRFSREQVSALAAGRVVAAMGPGFEAAEAHVRTPHLQAEPMLFLEEVTVLDPQGGPWGRGYLAAATDIDPRSWFFDGHFKNDPCMPGTLMFEGCLQAMAFYLTAMGFTLERDGWRFEPVPDEPYTMRCRGQVVPGSRRLAYEVFVREVVAGPLPTLYADLLCTVDGLKAFHAARVGLRLVPDWPLTSRPEVVAAARAAAGGPDARPPAVADGFRFDYLSLLACAWGRPSDAFGPMYRVFDGPRRVARLPGPPYHCMSRVVSIQGGMGKFEAGAVIEAEFDVPETAWYFDQNGAPTMPYAVLLEAGLQPCGWLASFVGSALGVEDDLSFRNLDGTGTLGAELLPGSGTLRTRVQLLGVSRSGGTVIERFTVECRQDERLVYAMTTVFGFFTAGAFANQVGLPPTPDEQAQLAAPSDFLVDLTARPARYCAGAPRIAVSDLQMLDRISGFWPVAGRAGLGRMRGEKDVDPSAWYFKAHFFQDPVQPGSLGLEAMVQLLQLYMLETGMAAGIPRPRFEPIAVDRPLTWKYRGQVLPVDRLVTVELEVTERGRDERGAYAVGDAWLWVDGRRIYAATGLAMRIVPGTGAGAELAAPSSEEVLDPAVDLWLGDHRPTWTVPALPMMAMVDRLAAAALAAHPGLQVVGIEDVQLKRWITFLGGPVRLRTVTGASEPRPDEATAVEVTLEVWRASANPVLSRFEAAATGRVLLAGGFPPPPEPLSPLPDAVPGEDPYAAGALFHGPAFQLLRQVSYGFEGSSATLDATAGAVPHGALHQALLDAATHAVPHDDLARWCGEGAEGRAGYPHRLRTAAFYGPPPVLGDVQCEARFLGFLGSEREARLPVVRLQLAAEGRVWADLEMVEVLLPKGPLGSAAPAARRRFLRHRLPGTGVALSRYDGEATRLREAELAASDWLPGTVAGAYAVGAGREAGGGGVAGGAGHAAVRPDDRRALTLAVAAKDHVARALDIHPAAVDLAADATSAIAAPLPLTRFPLTATWHGDEVAVRDAGPPWLDVAPLRDYWRERLSLAAWPTEDLYYTLIERFVGRVVLVDGPALTAIKGRSILFLGNHQVGVESLLFSIVASGLLGLPTVTLAKAEHRTSWLGRLIALCFSYPGVDDPGVITFFERDDLRSLPPIIRRLGDDMRRGKSAMVHAEGTRALSCRHTVAALSGSFIDMALGADAPIVPIRFSGGLPVEDVRQRLEFPAGYGRQDYWFGRPLLPEDLRALTYRERRSAVLAALNSVGPPIADEAPYPPDPDFGAEVAAWIAATGATEEHAVIHTALERATRHYSPDLERLLAMRREGRWDLPADPVGRWLTELAQRLFGRHGPGPQAG